MEREYLEEVNKIIEILSDELDISKTEFEIAVRSYEAVGDWLSDSSSSIAKFDPEVLPQGSFMLGTMIKPINDSDDLDIDLVCRLGNKPIHWTQHDIKEAVGNRLKEHQKYRNMLESQEGGRRCWTLQYKLDSGYHMDVLPSVVSEDFNIYLNEVFSSTDSIDLDRLAIRITDKKRNDFQTEINLAKWLKSNPFGYARWFFRIALVESDRTISLKSAVQPIQNFGNKKLPLQRIVQILKRHRDIMFSDESEYNQEHKPISIIITTLAARSYSKEEDTFGGLINVVGKMRRMIKDIWNEEKKRYEKWVVNPVNHKENFADKWIEEPLKEEYFFAWLDKLEEDISSLINGQGIGLYTLKDSMSIQFGEKLVGNVFKSYGNKARVLTETGKRKMAPKSGILGATGIPVKKHNFEGIDGE